MKPNLFPVRGYKRKIIRLFGQSSIVGYWPLNERLGATAFDVSGRGFHGAHTGIAPDQPGPGWGIATLYDGANDFTNVYSDALVAAFNGAEGTLAIWAKVSGAGVWTDATARKIAQIRVNVNNYVDIGRTATNSQLNFVYTAGATSKNVASTVAGGITQFIQCAISWSQSGDQLKAYVNGKQTGTTQTGLGTWSGVLGATVCLVGATNTIPGSVWSGSIAHVALWSTPLTAQQIDILASV